MGTPGVTGPFPLPTERHEVGAKGSGLGRRVQYDVPGFYYDFRDFQTNVQPELTPSGVLFRTGRL